MIKISLSDQELMNFVGKQESQEVLTFDSLVGEVQAHMKDGGLKGDQLPWSKTHFDVALGEGELSLWAGVNGHGKTVLLTYVMQKLMEKGRKVLIASMEMKPRETLGILCTQSAGCPPASGYIKQYLESHKDLGYVYDRLGRVPQHCIIGLCYYAKSLGINHLVVDSLTMCGIGRENYDAQAEFVNELRAAAKVNKLHVHLVCHMRKGEDEKRPVGKFDIRGAGEISDLADKVFIVWRNKEKELQQQVADQGLPHNPDILNQWGVKLKLVKNRQDGTEAQYGFNFDPKSKRYCA